MPAPHQFPRDGAGDGGFAVGALSLVLSIMPLLGLLAVPAGLIGVVVGLAGVQRLRDHTADNKAITWIGIGLNVAAIVTSIVLTVTVYNDILVA